MFGPETDNADAKEFADQCKDDRHHFRFIVSPEDAADMEDLKRFTRELMAQAEKDLGTKLEWAGVDHWNTDNPHVHVIVRGRTEDGQDLVIDRDYIKSGLRDRAQDLVTLELGPRADLDIRRSLERQIEADRWTQLDRQLVRDANEQGVIDVAPCRITSPTNIWFRRSVGFAISNISAWLKPSVPANGSYPATPKPPCGSLGYAATLSSGCTGL